jgi:hypothetical protein
LVLVEGEAGIGKSRLVDELAARLVGVRVVRWRCSPLETDFAFLAIAIALRGLEGGSEETSAVSVEGPAGALSFLDGLAAQIQRHAPFVLLMDRLDLADASSVSALGHLARRLADTPVAVVATCRTPAATRPPVSRLDWSERVRLERLTEDDLVDYQVPDLHARTGGHPVFLAAHLGSVAGGGGPVDVRERVLAWCADAGEEAMRILSAASVLPDPFDPVLLGQVLRVEVVGLAEELDRLCQHGLLREHGSLFAFRDAPVRQILEDNLSPGRRALLLALVSRARAINTGTTTPPDTGHHPDTIIDLDLDLDLEHQLEAS